MVEYIMKKEICGTLHAKCGTQNLTKVSRTVPQKAGRVVTLDRIVILLQLSQLELDSGFP
jgi:hypothetical protein